MGISASGLLDESNSNFIKGQAEAKLKEFSPYYRKQFSVAQFAQLEDELENNKQKITQLLNQREVPEDGEVLYQEAVLYFDDSRKWKDRYVVVRANYCLECHDSLETYMKGVQARYTLLPTGGSVLTTEEMYMAMVDKCFPGDSSVKEEFAPPLSGMPGQFPVYLRLPYRKDWYFCFKQQAKQAGFLAILSDCIRHQNQDFLKKKTCEVQAFLKAIQLYRQDRGNYEAWEMLIGSDVRVMANLVMEDLLPALEKDVLPRLKAKKTEKKKVWFATMEEAYMLVQQHLLEGLGALKEECRVSNRQQEVTIHSDMDQILNSRKQLEEKVRAKVTEPAVQLCSESVQPYLGSVLEELMEPVSSGFQEGRKLSEKTMDHVCRDVLQGGGGEQLKQALVAMARPNLLSCYQKISELQEKLQNLQERFGFTNIRGVIHGAQIDLQQLMENAASTFQLLLHKAMESHADRAVPAIQKIKHRVLKQYDYDSSSVRKKIFQDALVSITLPFIKKNLAPTCKAELQSLEESVNPDHANFLHVENVYESVLLQILDEEVSKVVKEAACLRKYNLFTESRDLLSQSTPTDSPLGSPALNSPHIPYPVFQPSSPLVVNGLRPDTEGAEDTALPKPDSAHETHREKNAPDLRNEPEETESRIQEEPVQADEAETKPEPEDPELSPDPTAEQSPERSRTAGQESPSPGPAGEADGPSPGSTSGPESPADEPSPVVAPSPGPTDVPITVLTSGPCATAEPDPGPIVETCSMVPPSPAPTGGLSPGLTAENPLTEEKKRCDSLELCVVAPSSGEEPEDKKLDQKSEPLGLVLRSLDRSADTRSTCSDSGSSDEVSTTSDILDVVESSMSSDEGPASPSVQDEGPAGPSVHDEGPAGPSTQDKGPAGPSVQDEGLGSGLSSQVQVVPNKDPETAAELVLAAEETCPSPDVRPLDCIKEIRDLVVEVIEVEEVAQHYPKELQQEE